MKRVVILGSPGSGKSVLARALGARLGLPVVHLDLHFWGDNWAEPTAETFAATVASLADADKWIMDGNYSWTLELRLARADTAILLDVPRRTRMRRIVLRHGRPRPDIPDGCKERTFSKDYVQFLRFAWTHGERHLSHSIALLNEHADRVEIITLHNTRGVSKFLESFP